jgi:hypothetical protein
MRDPSEIQDKISQWAKEIERNDEFIAALDCNSRKYRREKDSALKRIILYSDRIYRLQWALGEVD